MTISKIRTTAAVAASSLAIIALAACGSGGSVTKTESSSKAAETTSAAPTTDESTEPSDEPSEASPSDDASTEPSGDPSSEGSDVTIVKATDADLEPAKQFFMNWYELATTGKGDEACRQLYSKQLGGFIPEDQVDECAGGIKSSAEKGGIDQSAAKKGIAQLKPRLGADGTIELVNPAGKKIVIVKGSDGKYYYDVDSTNDQ